MVARPVSGYYREIVSTIETIEEKTSKSRGTKYYSCKLNTGNFITISEENGPVLMMLRKDLETFGVIGAGALSAVELVEHVHRLRIPLRFQYGVIINADGALFPQVWMIPWESRSGKD